jgi:hypothetical protein
VEGELEAREGLVSAEEGRQRERESKEGRKGEQGRKEALRAYPSRTERERERTRTAKHRGMSLSGERGRENGMVGWLSRNWEV